MKQTQSLNIEAGEALSCCYQCLQLSTHCFCDLLQRVANKTELLVLQHPKELRHPLGTAVIAMLGLQNIKRLQISGAMPIPDLERDCVLLYPSEGAVPLDQYPHNPAQLVVMDASWRQAKRIYRANPWLQALPAVRLSPKAPSRYRLRRAPRAQYLSTLESVVQALQILEPDLAGLDVLSETFACMVEHQWISKQDKSTRLEFRPDPAWMYPLLSKR